ncbi:MAG: 6,7-dimethyl-8-ribityllumazine synthase [Kiritimatiellia bacterium]|jgi:6,7-dimethyl-8-ribityllumazine synthase
MKEFSGNLDASGLKIAIVASRFNSFLTEQLVKGAADCFVRHGGSEADLALVRVPGASEIPLAVARLVKAGKGYDAIAAVGAVIRGATPHADLINHQVSRSLAAIGLESGVPVLNGIICADTLEQAVERAGTKAGNKGWDAMQAAIEMASLFRALP